MMRSVFGWSRLHRFTFPLCGLCFVSGVLGAVAQVSLSNPALRESPFGPDATDSRTAGYNVQYVSVDVVNQFSLTVSSDQVLQNGSFELWGSGDGAPPDAWELVGTGSTIARDATTKKIGNNAVRVTRGSSLTQCYQLVQAMEVDDDTPIPRMESPEVRPGATVAIRWDGYGNRLYTLYHSTNLLTGFSVLERDIPGTPPMNTYTDTVNGANAKFWKVSAQK